MSKKSVPLIIAKVANSQKMSVTRIMLINLIIDVGEYVIHNFIHLAAVLSVFFSFSLGFEFHYE